MKPEQERRKASQSREAFFVGRFDRSPMISFTPSITSRRAASSVTAIFVFALVDNTSYHSRRSDPGSSLEAGDRYTPAI
jgi:hypothetical protein